MSQLKNKPSYSQAPISGLDDLARIVNQSLDGLMRIARGADKSYHKVTLRKKDGSVRIAWAANRRLKGVQGYIKTRILDHVHFPKYLHGGICDPLYRRCWRRPKIDHFFGVMPTEN